MDKQKVKEIEKELKALATYLGEKRADIALEIDNILKGAPFDASNIESRFIGCDVPKDAVRALYDTNTTLIDFEIRENGSLSWVIGANHFYED